MGDLESLVQQSKDAISALIAKPKMVEKLLSKPPFRFLHDIISAITSTTGFAEGLYTEAELDSAGITDKQAKIDYLEKIFTFIGICKGAPLDVRAGKVVAGLEPENTNLFLIALAEVASDASCSSAQALQRFQAGESPGDGPPARKVRGPPRTFPFPHYLLSSSCLSLSPPLPVSLSPPLSPSLPLSLIFLAHSFFLLYHAHSGTAKAEAKESAGREPEAKAGAKAAPFEAKVQEVEQAPERGKSRGGTRGGKPQSQSADIGLSSPAINLDAEMDRCDGSLAVTQTLLGALITKPKLSDKLLSKPPFKFLYDIIMEVVRATGFATGLFSEEECDAAGVSEKNQKLLYLEKIIRVVGVQLNTLVEAKAAKIISGLDAEATNRFLQFLAVAAMHAPDSSSAVRSVLEQLGLPPNAEVSPSTAEAERPSVDDHRAESKAGPGPAAATAAPAAAAAPSSKASEPERREVGLEDKGGGGGDDDADPKRSSRPTTARRRPPKVKDGAKEVDRRETATAAKKAEGIMADGADDDDDEIPDETRLADDVAETKGAQGDPQSKLVKDILGRQAEQEAARHGGGSSQAADAAGEEAKGADETKGGIRLGRLRKTGVEKKGSISTTAVLAEGDIERLRAAVQVLVQHTGPLGSCLDFLQEDVGLMTAELRRWEEEARRYEVRADAERQRSQEILHPLQAELLDIDEQVRALHTHMSPSPLPFLHSFNSSSTFPPPLCPRARLSRQIHEQVVRISSTKANIARNEERLVQLLKLMSSS